MSEELPVPEVVLVLESVLAFEVLLVEELEPEFSVLSNEEVSELLTLSIPDIGSLLNLFLFDFFRAPRGTGNRLWSLAISMQNRTYRHY